MKEGTMKKASWILMIAAALLQVVRLNILLYPYGLILEAFSSVILFAGIYTNLRSKKFQPLCSSML